MRALLYVRPWSINYFKYIGEHIFGKENCYYFSDHLKIGLDEYVKLFYSFFNLATADQIDSYLDKNIYTEIIEQDRLLRSIPYKTACRMLISSYKVIEHLLDKSKPEIVISITIDCYVTDLLERLAKNRGIPFFGITTPFINDYMLITSRGELNDFRKPNREEIEYILKKLSNKGYQGEYMKKYPVTTRFLLKQWGSQLIKVPYFLYKKSITSDPLNYHNWSTYILAKQKINPTNIFFRKLYNCDWKDRLLVTESRSAYLPLQLFPEMNAEYWCPNRQFMPYEDGIVKLVDAFQRHVKILVKEHPAMLGLRDISFYKKLKEFKNVLFVPTHESQREILNIVDFALTMNSSVGIEAFFENKPVVTTGNPYYGTSRLHINIETIDELNDIPKLIEKISSTKNESAEDQYSFIENILSSCIPCNPNEIHFNSSDKNAIKRVDHVVTELKKNIPLWLEWAKEKKSLAID